MPTYEQTPAVLNLVFNRGNNFSALLDMDIDMTGYTVAAELLSLVTGGVVATLTTAFVSAAAGTLNVSLVSTLPAGTYGWRLTWVGAGVTRTALVGMVELLP